MPISVIDALISIQDSVDNDNLRKVRKKAAKFLNTVDRDCAEFQTLQYCVNITAHQPGRTARDSLAHLWRSTPAGPVREIIFFCGLNHETLTASTFGDLNDAPELSDRMLIRSAARDTARHLLNLAADSYQPEPPGYADLARVMTELPTKRQEQRRAKIRAIAQHSRDRRLGQIIQLCDQFNAHRPEQPARASLDYEADPDTRPNDSQPAYARSLSYGLDRYETPYRTTRQTSMPNSDENEDTDDSFRLPQPRGLRDTPYALDPEVSAWLESVDKTVSPDARKQPCPEDVEPRHVTDYVASRLGVDDDRNATAGGNLDIYDGYSWDDEDAPVIPLATLPCVACHQERQRRDTRTASREDGLCATCRAAGHTGIPALSHRPAYLPKHVARVAAVCDWITQNQTDAAPALFAALARHSTPADRAAVKQWRAASAPRPAQPARGHDEAASIADLLNRADTDAHDRAALDTETDTIQAKVIKLAEECPRAIGTTLREWREHTHRPAELTAIARAIRQLTGTGAWTIQDGELTQQRTDKHQPTQTAA